jgi:hypothetical protein
MLQNPTSPARVKAARRRLPIVPQYPTTPSEIDVLYLHLYDTQRTFKEPLQYLHTRRLAKYAYQQQWLKQVQEYYGVLEAMTERFCEDVPAVAMADLVVQAPSNDPSSDPYFARLVLQTGLPSLRRHFWIKDKNHSAGASDAVHAGPEYAAIKWRGPDIPDLTRFTRVIIVDDVFATGKTVAATWARLLEAGLSVDAQVMAGVALLV